jgi:hypothetical protein
LKAAAAASDAKATSDADQQTPQKENFEEDETLTELDKEGFNAETFVNNILLTSGLEGILKVEADLVSQIRNLDSDRKSLVYDNYSKLIAATDTIRKMRTNMDPLAPTTHTLSPAIAHIAETAASLSASMQERPGPKREAQRESEAHTRMMKEKETVRWVLGTPRRLTEMLDDGLKEDAAKEWDEVRQILDKWEGTAGVAELIEECEIILDGEESEGSDEQT